MTSRRKSRETIEQKADRLLITSSVWVETAVAGLVRARVTGDSGEAWIVTRETRWSCSCPYPYTRRDCSHIAAVKRVTDRPNSPGRNVAPAPARQTGVNGLLSSTEGRRARDSTATRSRT